MLASIPLKAFPTFFSSLLKLSIKITLAFLLIGYSFSTLLLAQDEQNEPIVATVSKLSNDTSKVNALIQLAEKSIKKNDSASVKYFHEALKIADSLNFSKGKAEIYKNLAFHHKEAHQHKMALQYFDSSLNSHKETGDLQGSALTYNYIGSVYFEGGNFRKASDYYRQALKRNKSLKNDTEIVNNIYNIGLCYEKLGNHPLALKYYLECLALDEAAGNNAGVSADYSAIATIYSKEGDYENANDYYLKSLKLEREAKNNYGIASTLLNLGINLKLQKKYDEAIKSYNEALQLFELLDSEKGISLVYNNLGTVYYLKDDQERARQFLHKSTQLDTKLGAKHSLSEANRMLSKIYLRYGDVDSALVFALEGLEFARETDSKEIITNLHFDLANIYKKQDKVNQAFFHLEEHLIYKDSLYNKEKSKQIKELQTKYETDKKEQQIALLNQEKILQATQLENKSLTQKLLFGAIGVIIMFGFIGFRYTRIKQESKRILLSEQLKVEKSEAERLQEMDKLKGRFFANIAHEFRTPLTLILGPLEEVTEQIKKKAHKEQLQLVQSNAVKLLRLINQLLDLSKLESGIIKLELVQDDIILFLKGITHSFHSLAEQKDITLAFQSKESEVIMDFDKDKVEKILFNLLSNAFKFTPSSGYIQVDVAREIRHDHQDEHLLRVLVKDSGTGIPENQRAKVFNRFYQANNSQVRDAEGSGIGLALTKELVEILGGEIEVLGGQEKGAAFVFRLPVRNESQHFDTIAVDQRISTDQELEIDQDGNLTASKAEQQKSKITINNQHLPKEIVLIIEDNEDVRHFISRSLKDTYKILEAANGEEGVSMAKEHIPDMVISDIMMPKRDGYETCHALKSDEATSHIPIILLTAKAGLESKLEGLETGADDYLPKPFNTRELKVRMKNLIKLRKNLRKKFLQGTLSENESTSVATAPIENAFLKKIREIVEEHLEEEEFSVEDLSLSMAMSRTQVHRKLKALTNQSASQFMRMIRLQKAKELLTNNNVNVSEVAYKVGFSSPTYFSTCFAEFYGYAPSEQKYK